MHHELDVARAMSMLTSATSRRTAPNHRSSERRTVMDNGERISPGKRAHPEHVSGGGGVPREGEGLISHAQRAGTNEQVRTEHALSSARASSESGNVGEASAVTTQAAENRQRRAAVRWLRTSTYA